MVRLQTIERGFGRQRAEVQNAPRSLDLDLITFKNELRATPALILPHPRAASRKFVLAPLNEIAPDFVIPGQSETVKSLLDGLGPEQVVKKLAT